MDNSNLRRSPAHDWEAVEEGRLFIQMVLTKVLDYAGDIQVENEVGSQTVVYKVSCNAQDLGKLIGVHGKNISGLRSLLNAVTAKKGLRSIIEIPYLPKPRALE